MAVFPVYGFIVAAFVGTAVGLGRWLIAPVVEQTATSPESVLRSDRRALFLTVGTVAVGLAAAVVGMAWASGSWGGMLPDLVLANTVVVVVLVGSGGPWLCYTITRLWLALWGQLPWRLTRFLRHAHAAGVLRQAGPAYQFRHDMLRAYLADHGPPTRRCGLIVQPSGPTRHRPVLRRWSWWRRFAGIGIAVSLLPVTTGFIVPNPLRASSSWVFAGWSFSVAFSVDGTIASGNSDGTVRLWDANTGRLRRTISANPLVSNRFGVVLSQDGSMLAAAPRDQGIVRLWDPATGNLRRTLTADSDTKDLYSLAFSPDGLTLAAAGNGTGISLWDPATGQLRRTLPTSTSVESLAFSPDGSTLATGEDDGHVQLRDSASGRPRYTFIADIGSVDSVAFNPNGSTLASAGGDGVIRLWNVAMLERQQPR